MKVKIESEVAQSCLTLSDPMGCSLPGSSVHGIFQARVLEWGATAFSSNGGDPGSIPGLGRSIGEGIGYPLQYSALKNSMDCILHGVSKSWSRLSDFHFQGTKICQVSPASGTAKRKKKRLDK